MRQVSAAFLLSMAEISAGLIGLFLVGMFFYVEPVSRARPGSGDHRVLLPGQHAHRDDPLRDPPRDALAMAFLSLITVVLSVFDLARMRELE
jgi:hypothetical protein